MLKNFFSTFSVKNNRLVKPFLVFFFFLFSHYKIYKFSEAYFARLQQKMIILTAFKSATNAIFSSLFKLLILYRSDEVISIELRLSAMTHQFIFRLLVLIRSANQFHFRPEQLLSKLAKKKKKQKQVNSIFFFFFLIL